MQVQALHRGEAKEITGIPLSWEAWAFGVRCEPATHSLHDLMRLTPGQCRQGPCVRSAALAAHKLRGVEGLEVTSWEALAEGPESPMTTSPVGGLRDRQAGVRLWRGGRPLDSFCHHWAACSGFGLLGRGFVVESAAARVCREAGGRERHGP